VCIFKSLKILKSTIPDDAGWRLFSTTVFDKNDIICFMRVQDLKEPMMKHQQEKGKNMWPWLKCSRYQRIKR
jgi:hypothetical protein